MKSSSRLDTCYGSTGPSKKLLSTTTAGALEGPYKQLEQLEGIAGGRKYLGGHTRGRWRHSSCNSTSRITEDFETGDPNFKK